MSKKFIQQLVREDLMSRLREAGKNTEKKNKPEPTGKKDEEKYTTKTDDSSQEKDQHELNAGEKKKVKTMTNKIKNATQGSDRILKLSQVMSASGALCGDKKCEADNASHRSMIGKAVSGKPDADGKQRHLDLQQATAMSKVIDNPPAYN